MCAQDDNSNQDQDDEYYKELPPNDNEGNIFEWAEENLEDEYWKNDPD